MSLNVALDAGWFSQVLWIFPTKQLPEQLELTTFQKQLIEAQIATPEEAASFTLNKGSFAGIVRGLPFTAAPAEALPPLEESALLHIDVDYFKPLYSGEIKTPLYPLMIGLLDKIKVQNWKIAAASVALSNQPFDGLPLQTRFLGKDLATVLQNPRMFQEAFPRQWERRGNALYLENFMQKEEIHKIYTEMELEDPRDPDVKFGLYNISRQLNKTGESLTYLKAAVQIDPVYAQEYLALSQLAMEKNLPPKAVEMLQLARNAQPDNPFILTLLVHTLLSNGLKEEVKTLKPELAALNWSKIYYPQQAEAKEATVKLLDGE
jgi:tetratricopeptide (TPR) repeat protein